MPGHPGCIGYPPKDSNTLIIFVAPTKGGHPYHGLYTANNLIMVMIVIVTLGGNRLACGRHRQFTVLHPTNAPEPVGK